MADGDAGRACVSLRERGYAVIPELLGASLCQQLLKEVHASHAMASSDKEDDKPVYCATCRHNIMLHVTHAVQEAARLLLNHEVYATEIETLLGQEAAIFELAAMMSFPGAAQQPLHRDTLWVQQCESITAFMALTDIPEAAWGPTALVAGTHDQAHWHYHDFNSPACCPGTAGCLDDSSAMPIFLARGDCLLMDSRTFHRGSANSIGERVLFYFSLRRRDAFPRSSTESLLDEYKQRAHPLTLATISGQSAASAQPVGVSQSVSQSVHPHCLQGALHTLETPH